jgi:3-oxoacyl-[acyl-carrier protein] reductase
MKLESKVALVTGAARGIGRATALKLAQEGANVIVCDVNLEDAEATAKDIEALGRKAMASNANIAVREDVDKMFEDIKEKFGRLDILVNNAGITKDAQFLKMTEAAWDAVMAVNLKGIFNVTQNAAAMMKEQNYGKIISLSSLAGQIGNFGQANYAASKAGVMGLTKTLCKELARYNVNVNAIAPGSINTPMFAAVPEKVIEGMKAQIPLGRLGLPEDIANCVAFLASEDSAYITGQTISVNGGWFV